MGLLGIIHYPDYFHVVDLFSVFEYWGVHFGLIQNELKNQGGEFRGGARVVAALHNFEGPY